jgi:hypothetical protein
VYCSGDDSQRTGEEEASLGGLANYVPVSNCGSETCALLVDFSYFLG